ncbi:MAG: hypothetical protein ACD_78C00454G0002 [uncultured bacterium (gcode 4)]|uniref:YcfA family protein n=1 Tax=uncultured bacterium (gcode 4) TaxID=1234023 RepID=K1YA32_9BACT|nr:MAG: hypothetical protein ACD_78C00454G0002 [uncultured bacterium (gcode 4)]
MKQYKPKNIIIFLENHWWEQDHITGSHVIMYHSISKKRTTVPLHKKDIPVGTLLAILKQTGLTKEDLGK